jgi:hypothetical protein
MNLKYWINIANLKTFPVNFYKWPQTLWNYKRNENSYNETINGSQQERTIEKRTIFLSEKQEEIIHVVIVEIYQSVYLLDKKIN